MEYRRRWCRYHPIGTFSSGCRSVCLSSVVLGNELEGMLYSKHCDMSACHLVIPVWRRRKEPRNYLRWEWSWKVCWGWYQRLKSVKWTANDGGPLRFDGYIERQLIRYQSSRKKKKLVKILVVFRDHETIGTYHDFWGYVPHHPDAPVKTNHFESGAFRSIYIHGSFSYISQGMKRWWPTKVIPGDVSQYVVNAHIAANPIPKKVPGILLSWGMKTARWGLPNPKPVEFCIGKDYKCNTGAEVCG